MKTSLRRPAWKYAVALSPLKRTRSVPGAPRGRRAIDARARRASSRPVERRRTGRDRRPTSSEMMTRDVQRGLASGRKSAYPITRRPPGTSLSSTSRSAPGPRCAASAPAASNARIAVSTMSPRSGSGRNRGACEGPRSSARRWSPATTGQAPRQAARGARARPTGASPSRPITRGRLARQRASRPAGAVASDRDRRLDRRVVLVVDDLDVVVGVVEDRIALGARTSFGNGYGSRPSCSGTWSTWLS